MSEKKIPVEYDLTGKVFHRLTVLEFAGVDKFKNRVWRCLCSCGKTTVVRASRLTSGKSKSCGCWRKDALKGPRHPNWMGGCRSRGSIAWCRSRIQSSLIKAKKNGHSPVNLNENELSKLVMEHDGYCAICKVHQDDIKGGFHIDHCHHTGNFRGFLCPACNKGMGLLGDDPTLLRTAADYLEASGSFVSSEL